MLDNLFVHVLSQARGNKVDEASDELRKLIEAIDETGKGGEMSVTIKVAVQKDDPDIREITVETKCKMPKGKQLKSIFFTDRNGGLVRTDPKQAEMFAEREQRGVATIGVAGNQIAAG
jgi:hypothetical protein